MLGVVSLFIFVILLPFSLLCFFNGYALISILAAIPGILAGIYYLVKQAVKDAIEEMKEKEDKA